MISILEDIFELLCLAAFVGSVICFAASSRRVALQRFATQRSATHRNAFLKGN
jgi:hypothetical protein